MFRKVGHILLIAVLLITTMGFSLSKHYCHNHLVTVSVNAEAKSCCGNSCKSSCCHNETLYYQLKENFVASASQNITPAIQLDILFPIELVVLENTLKNTEKEIILPVEFSPPKPINTKLSEIQSYLL